MKKSSINMSNMRMFGSRLPLRFLPYILLAVMVVTGMPSAFAQDEQADRVVRVGCYESPFWKKDKQGKRSGYTYEYLRRIASHTGWHYEYVEGEWPDLMAMLEEGTIDILDNVSYYPERDSRMLFSEMPMGQEEFYIMSLVEHPSVDVGDAQSLSGKKVGVDKGSYEEQLLRSWARKTKIAIQIVPFYLHGDEHMRVLKSGELDAVVASTSLSLFFNSDVVPVANIGSAPYYFAINIQRPELKEQMDYVIGNIHLHNPYYNSELRNKYLHNTGLPRYLTIHERDWLKQHGTIRIAYRDNYLPYCAADKNTGELTGMLHDFLQYAEGALGNAEVKFEAKAYPTINEAMDAVLRGEADAAFPNALSNYDAEMAHMLITTPLVTSTEMAIIRNGDSFQPNKPLRAAVNSYNPNYIALVQNNFPHWQFVYFGTIDESLKGVSKGEADLILFSNYRLGVMSEQMKDLGLKSVASGLETELVFSIDENNNELYSIMSRLTNLPTETDVQAWLADYSETKHTISLKRFLKENMLFVCIFLAVFISVILVLLRRTRRERNRAEELTVKQHAQLEEITALNHELETAREGLLQAKKEADSANQAKTSFLFNMSHDIRTPMNAIMGFTNLLRKHQEDSERRADYLDKIENASDVLLSIINNVLEMARIEKGTIEFTETAENVEQFNDVLVSIFSELMEQKNIRFSTSVNVQHHCVMCDTTKLREVYYNILSNACKYTEEGGSVEMHLEELQSPREGYVLFRSTVKDTGIGMSEEFLPHLFEEFSRENNTTANKIEGTGLGMPIVKRLVDLMGGIVEVQSKKGVGTTFVITIPFKIADKVVVQKPAKTDFNPDTFEGKRLLLAEDNELNAEIAMEILGEVGLLVERACDGQECVEMLDKAEAGYYNAILMDIQMPNMNGYEATKAIRAMADPKKAGITILAMTANAFEEDKRKAVRVGMNGHLSKPVNVAELMKTLSSCLA